MRKCSWRLWAVAFFSLTTVAHAQTITGITPATAPTSGQGASGPVVLTISGTSFDGVGNVTVGGRLCPVTLRSPVVIECALPPGEGADLDIDLYEGPGPSVAVKAPQVFSYLPPSLTAITPAAPPATSGGATLTLLGENFGLFPSIFVGDAACSSTEQIDHNTARCVLGEGEGAGVPVTMTVAGQTSIAPLSLSFAAPEVTQVTPASAPTSGGFPITLNGSNFGVAPTVTVGGQDCPVDPAVSGHGLLVCEVPPGEGAEAVGVVNAAGQIAAFSFGYDPPSITSISPSSGPTRGGYVITLNGSNFSSTSSVTIGSSSCPVLSADSVEVRCEAPEGEGTDADVTVAVAGQVSVSPAAFSYDPPEILSITPASVAPAGGDTITINGRNFGRSPSVSVDGQDCPLDPTDGAYVAHETLVCIAPAGSGMNRPLVVAAGGQLSPPGVMSYSAVVCDPGSFTADGESCSPCPEGRFSDAAGAVACQACPPGTAQATPGQTSCEPCAAGTYAPGEGTLSCLFCPTGTAQSEAGRDRCDACAPGTFSSSAGAQTCDSCPACPSCDNGLCDARTGACPMGGACPACGDGEIGTGEACDDSNQDSDDGCSSTCGVEDGYACTYDGASASSCVLLETCGNGRREPGEACDDRDDSDFDGCSAACQLEAGFACAEDDAGVIVSCTEIEGDGLVVGAERCDDGNEDSDDGCSVGAIEDGYACDDQEPSGCTRLDTCGDGVVDEGEDCDDGTRTDNDGCSAVCTREAGFDCVYDDVRDSEICTPIYGDGLIVGDEACDDSNSDSLVLGCVNGRVSDGYGCDGAEPSRCAPLERCGDGVIDVGEECDDGNVTDEDGCSAACREETTGEGEGCACAAGAQDLPWAPVFGLVLLSLPLLRRRRSR
jgi:MYXO-CTERM domain-containing protein